MSSTPRIAPGLTAVPMRLPGQRRPSHELVMLTPLGGARYRIECTPLSGSGKIYAGDVIDTVRDADGGLVFRRVARRSPMRSWTFTVSAPFFDRPEFRAFVKRVQRDRGSCASTFGLLTVQLPGATTLDPEAELNALGALDAPQRGLDIPRLGPNAPPAEVAATFLVAATVLTREGWTALRGLCLSFGGLLVSLGGELGKCATLFGRVDDLERSGGTFHFTPADGTLAERTVESLQALMTWRQLRKWDEVPAYIEALRRVSR